MAIDSRPCYKCLLKVSPSSTYVLIWPYLAGPFFCEAAAAAVEPVRHV